METMFGWRHQGRRYALCARCAGAFRGDGSDGTRLEAEAVCDRCGARAVGTEPLAVGTAVAMRWIVGYDAPTDTEQIAWYAGVVREVQPVAGDPANWRYRVHCPEAYPPGSAGAGDPDATVTTYHTAGTLLVAGWEGQ